MWKNERYSFFIIVQSRNFLTIFPTQKKSAAPTTTDSNSTQQTPLLSKKKIKDENQNDDQYNSKISPVFREIRSGLDMEIKTKSNGKLNEANVCKSWINEIKMRNDIWFHDV